MYWKFFYQIHRGPIKNVSLYFLLYLEKSATDRYKIDQKLVEV